MVDGLTDIVEVSKELKTILEKLSEDDLKRAWELIQLLIERAGKRKETASWRH